MIAAISRHYGLKAGPRELGKNFCAMLGKNFSARNVYI